ncbi:MAG: hypothetical protein WBP41_13710 [Saprospiraceae bacterium]
MKVILYVLFCLITDQCLCQNYNLDKKKNTIEPESILGTWIDSIPNPGRFESFKGTIIINSDSILISSVRPTMCTNIQLLEYSIVNDTIFAVELKLISIDINAGTAHSYFDHRQLKIKIPLCHLFNTCLEDFNSLTSPGSTSLCVKKSDNSEIKSHWDDALALYQNAKRN